MLRTTAVNTILTLLVGRGLRLRVVALARRMQRSVVDVENETIASRRAELLRQLMVELRDRECELNSMAAAHQRHAEAWQRDDSRATRLQDKCSQLHSQYTSLLLDSTTSLDYTSGDSYVNLFHIDAG